MIDDCFTILRRLISNGFILLALIVGLLIALGASPHAIAQVVSTKTASYTATTADCDPLGQRTIVMTVTVGQNNTIYLPGAGLNGQAINGCKITVVNLQSGSLFIQPLTPDTVNLRTNTSIAQRKSLILISQGTPSSGTNSWVALGE